jgi:ribosomal protein L37E
MSFSVPWAAIILMAPLIPCVYVSLQPRPQSIQIQWVAYPTMFSLVSVWSVVSFRCIFPAMRLIREAKKVRGYACTHCGFGIGEQTRTDICPECGHPYHAERARSTWQGMGPGWWKEPKSSRGAPSDMS